MYRDDNFGGGGLHLGVYHSLAEAIRAGCRIMPKKAVGRYFGRKKACALGAAVAGIGLLREGGKDVSEPLALEFPYLFITVKHPFLQIKRTLWQMLLILNDETDLSREEIADWLCVYGGCTHAVETTLLKDGGNYLFFSPEVVK